MPSSTTARPVVHEMRDYVREVGRDYGGASIKGMIEHAARKLGITFGRAQNFWYDEVRRVEADEADMVRGRAHLARLERLQRQRAEYEAARREFLETAPAALVALVPPALDDLEGAPAQVTPADAGGRR